MQTRACRILRSVLLSAAVIGVQPVLIIEVGTHWQQVKGIKSHLTLSGGSRILVKQYISYCHFVDVTLVIFTLDVALWMTLY